MRASGRQPPDRRDAVSEGYSTKGPICPHCSYQHRADEPFFFDEDMTEMECQSCDTVFGVRVYTSTSWTTEPHP